MTIAKAFNDIAVAQGGTASKSGTITGALDALTDALAGSDQPAPQTIEAGVRMLGEHIGGGGGGDFSGLVEISAVGAGTYYVSISDTNNKNICGVSLQEEQPVLFAGGAKCVITFDDTPAGTPTATLGAGAFTDFTYTDYTIQFTIPDGGEDEPALTFIFAG